MRNAAYHSAQLFALLDFVSLVFAKKIQLVISQTIILYTVKNHLLSICYGYQSESVARKQMSVDFLSIWILNN